MPNKNDDRNRSDQQRNVPGQGGQQRDDQDRGRQNPGGNMPNKGGQGRQESDR